MSDHVKTFKVYRATFIHTCEDIVCYTSADVFGAVYPVCWALMSTHTPQIAIHTGSRPKPTKSLI